jgi:cytochrome c biogenesis protein
MKAGRLKLKVFSLKTGDIGMRIYKLISSMTAGLILLALIGIASAIGSSLWPDIFFKTAAFRILLLLLFINMTLCTGNRLNSFLKQRETITKHGYIGLRNTGNILLHLGIVLIIIGAIIFSYLGYTTQLSILEGHTVDIQNIIPAENPFKIKLTNFSIAFHDDGSPSQYYSELEISEPGKKVRQQTISVNHPLTYAGIKAYQNSYGYLLDTLIEDGATEEKTKLFRDGDFVQFTATKRTVKVFKYIPNFDPAMGLESKSLKPDNPRIIYSVYDGTKLLGVGTATMGERIKIADDVFIGFQQARPFAVLTLKSDPGLPLVAWGGLFLMLGVSIALFTPPKR